MAYTSYDGGLSQWEENPFKDAKKVKEYLLDTYSMEFVLWVKNLLGPKFEDFGDTPIITDDFKKSLDIKMTELHTLFQQKQILETARDVAQSARDIFRGIR
jgi:hypothetical protein